MNEINVAERPIEFAVEKFKTDAEPFAKGAGTVWRHFVRQENPETGERAGFLRIIYDTMRMKAARSIYRRRMMKVNRPSR